MSSDPAATEPIDPTIWKVVGVVSIGPFLSQMDSTLVNVSLSTIGQTLHASIATAQWVVSAYLLAMALMLPLNGWLVDRVGAKRVYLFCFGAFTVASVICGVAQSMGELIAARIVQGLIGGIMAPMAQMMIGRVAGRHIEKVMGFAALPLLLAPVFGPVLAGGILVHASWPWLFFINVPIGALGVVMAARLLPADTDAVQARPFDLLGFALVSPGLVALIDGLQNASRAEGRGLALAGMVLLSAFGWHSIRNGRAGKAPLIDVRIFAKPRFAVPAMTQCLANAVLYGRQLVVPLFLIVGCGLSAAHAGSLLAATGVGMMCTFPLLGRLTERLGCRGVAAGGALLALLGALPFVYMAGHHFHFALAVVSLFLAGAGQGMIGVPSVSAAYAAIPKNQLAVANTALNIVQRIGGPLATTLLSMTIASSATAAHPFAPVDASHFAWAFLVLVAMHLLCVLAAMGLPVRVQRPNRD
ncbi:DHA2 family efflux MFS transporter permease subunit [Robbsia sp. KACC 23696]|uniref:DHA2 family efflux MFS transporter permease subunit n=1 Tax=Robbsia sp. KACC 23696 TaxID=3149231 RepID=UPI00325C1E26